jgi:hypothetical protein
MQEAKGDGGQAAANGSGSADPKSHHVPNPGAFFGPRFQNLPEWGYEERSLKHVCDATKFLLGNWALGGQAVGERPSGA